MGLRPFVAAAAIAVALASAGGGTLPAGADATPAPTHASFLPLVLTQPTHTPTATPFPTATPVASAACMGDEEVSFTPNPGATGSAVLIRATSARPSVHVALRLLYGGVEQAVAWQGVGPGDKGYVWSWAITPTQPGQYTARFYIDIDEYCAGGTVQVNGDPQPTATATAAPPPTSTPTPTATPTSLPTPSSSCGGDEEISFAPDPGATGSSMTVAATSAQPSANVAMQVLFASAAQALAWQGVVEGGKGYIWSWTLTPYQPGRYDAAFYVNSTAFCAARSVQVLGTPVATPTGTRTPTTTPTQAATPTRTPTPGGQPGLEWDWRLSFLNIQLQRAGGSPRWSVVKGVFQDWNEGSQGHSIFVDVVDESGNRLSLAEGTEIGTVSWPGGSSPLYWGAKPPNEYPVNFPMYSGLGSYTVWVTLGLPSDHVAGMGLVGTDPDGNLLPVPGLVHVNYLFTFRKTW